MEEALALLLMMTGLLPGRVLNLRNILGFAGFVAAYLSTVVICGGIAAVCFGISLLR